MKKILLFAAIAATLASCKTTEANYRAAYETAKEKQQTDGSGIESSALSTYGAPRPNVTAEGDTLPMRTEPIGFPADGGATREQVKRYCIVVGQFRQIFNAKAMRTRLIDEGYTDACILNTREPVYYVIATMTDSSHTAAEQLKTISADTRLKLKSPLPFVLQPAHLSR